MSVAFVPPQKGRPSPSPAQIQKMLDENSQLIQGILDYQSKGKSSECLQYQQILHRNLVYLASIADAVPSILPPPPTQGSAGNQPSGDQPSPAMNPGATSQNQMSMPASGPRAVQQPPGPSSSGPAQGPASSSSPHASYNMASQPNPQQVHQANHVHSPSTQPSTQATHSTTHNTQNSSAGNAAYSSRSVTPQQYGSVQGGAPQQYSGTYSSAQGQSAHPYSGSVQSPNSFPQQQPQGSSGNFPNEAASNFQAPVTQPQGFGTGNPPQQQVATNPNQQQQHGGPPAPDYAGGPAPQASYTSAPTAATGSQSYTTQSSQTYATQTQSYNSASSTNSTAPWYQANNGAQPTSSQPNFPPSTAPQQGYGGGTVNHSGNFVSQPTGAAQSGGYGSPPSSIPSQVQQGFVHHSSPSAAPPHESPPPTAPVQPNRFPSNFSNYGHYRPPAQQAPHSMGPPPNNVSRPQVPNSTSQNQNYNYDQSQTYPYQSQ